MEAEPIVLPDNTVLDTSKPPPGFNFPKPDFSAVISDDTNEPTLTEKSEGPLTKPTFKSALQAKKRLQAFSSNRAGSLPSSPSAKKVKPNINSEEKNDDAKKTPKKGNYHDDKAKAVIEEIEELKRAELQRLTCMRSRSRSRSRSQDKERFKKLEKKIRNYRKRSPTPEKLKKVVIKKPKKYPKNWHEFVDTDSTFDLNRDFEISPPKGNNELLRQILFESPSLPITQFKMKTANKEDKVVPFEYIRYTRTKPVLPYSVNHVAIKDKFLPRKLILETLPKDIVNNIECLYSNSLKFKVNSNHKNNVRTWFPKVWKDSENDCKLLEKSVGLSFLQTYTGEEEENELIEEPDEKSAKSVPQTNEEKSENSLEDGNEEKTEVKRRKNKKETEEQPAKRSKKKKHRKEKKKCLEAGISEDANKKKHKKDKKKKHKHLKEKKVKHKKVSKEKKKKDKSIQEEDKLAEKSNKQQVIEELKKIEEKLAQKREQDNKIKLEKKVEREEKVEKEKGRKRKHSEHEDNSKRVKHEKYQKERESSCESKPINTLKKKIDKEVKIDLLEIKLEEKRKKQSEKSKLKTVEDHVNKDDYERRTKSFEEADLKNRNKKKSRWSEPVIKQEEIEYMNSINIEDEIKRIDEVIKKHEKFSMDDEGNKLEESKNNEPMKEKTPDTEEYHSHWESDDDITSSVRHQSAKMNRSWESDEELFERTYNRNKPSSENYANLEIPLNIKNFSRRAKWEENPPYIDTITEFKMLEEERKNLSEERRKLELEKQKILKMQEEAKLELEEKKNPEIEEQPKETIRMNSSTPEIGKKVKKEKCDLVEFNLDSLNNSLLSNVSSTESNFPIAILENEYEEFIKAVNSDSTIQPKKKQQERRDSQDSTSSSSSSSSSESDHKKKRRKKKKKKKKKSREHDGLLFGKGNNIFNEFDIPVPSDLPEIIPAPVPVPSPIETILPITTNPGLLIKPIIDLQEKPETEPNNDTGLNLTKPFVFSSIILPSKKAPLVDTSNLNINDDSDSADFTDKFVKKVDTKKAEENVEETMSVQNVEKERDKNDPEGDTELKAENTEKKRVNKEVETKKIEKIEKSKHDKMIDVMKKIEEESRDAFFEENRRRGTAKVFVEDRKTEERESKPKPPPSPDQKFLEKPKEKRRSRTRSRERDLRRRSPVRRRDSSPPSRRRYSSPRRRTPPRRRGSPRRRSPSPRSPRRRMSPPSRRRRRTPSLSPPRSRGGARKRSLSPRIRRVSSPLNSPLDGFKRSVADSTISDDMLPQPTPEDYVESPPMYRKSSSKRSSLSPPISPKRISLDDRINQVLGLEKNEPAPKAPTETAYPASYGYGPTYGHQYNQYPQQYGQFGVQAKNDYVSATAFGAPMFTQPPPPIVKPVPTPTKVVQVGNILQVVPTDEIPQNIIENKPAETSQKIVQVGNMLQIVPAVIPPTMKPPISEPSSLQPAQSPEKQSAEALMKQKAAERKAEREKRRQERERRRKEKDKKRKEKERRRQMKLKIKTENMIKRAIQLEAEALACEDLEEEAENADLPVQWPPVSVVVSSTPSCKGILVGEGASKKRKSVQFADGVRPGEGTSPSGGEELSSPPPTPQKLPKERRYKKLKIPKKSKKKKIKVKVIKKKVQNTEGDEEDDEDDNLPPPSPPPGSPPPHVFPSRVKTHTINNVHQYVGNIIQSSAAGFPFRPPIPMTMAINRHPAPPGFIPGTYHHSDASGISHQAYQGVSSHH